MPLSQIASRFGATIGLFFLLSIIDSVVSGYLESETYFRALAGMHEPISGDLEHPVASVDQLTYISDTHFIRLDLIEAKGRIWRGKLMVAPAALQGTFHLRVYAAGGPMDANVPVLTVQVFEDPRQYRASYKSVIRRLWGLSPLWLVLATLPLGVASLWLSYFLSGRREASLADKGIVPIVKMARLATHWEISFELGQDQGIAPGDNLLLLDEALRPVGQVTAARVEPGKSQAFLDFTAHVAPSFFIAKNQPEKP